MDVLADRHPEGQVGQVDLGSREPVQPVHLPAVLDLQLVRLRIDLQLVVFVVGQLGEQLGGLDRQPGPDRGHHGVTELGQQIGDPRQVASLRLQPAQLGVLARPSARRCPAASCRACSAPAAMAASRARCRAAWHRATASSCRVAARWSADASNSRARTLSRSACT